MIITKIFNPPGLNYDNFIFLAYSLVGKISHSYMCAFKYFIVPDKLIFYKMSFF